MRRKVLIIDDEPELVDALKERLEAEGYEVGFALDGDEGVRLAKKSPDVILLDMTIPPTDGVTLYRDLKGFSKTRIIPVVILTGYEPDAEFVGLLKKNGDRFFMKPFDTKGLVEAIRNVTQIVDT